MWKNPVRTRCRYLKQTGLGKHRCALLFGRVSPNTNGIKVEAMYEPPQKQQSGSTGTYDSSALTEAARVAVAAAAAARDEDGSGGSETCETEGAAAAEVARAVRVAELLGLRLVGWCLSHDKVREGVEEGIGGEERGEGKRMGGSWKWRSGWEETLCQGLRAVGYTHLSVCGTTGERPFFFVTFGRFLCSSCSGKARRAKRTVDSAEDSVGTARVTRWSRRLGWDGAHDLLVPSPAVQLLLVVFHTGLPAASELFMPIFCCHRRRLFLGLLVSSPRKTKRDHFMAATDVVTAAALQLMSMAEKGKEEGVLVATVAVPVNATSGEVRGTKTTEQACAASCKVRM